MLRPSSVSLGCPELNPKPSAHHARKVIHKSPYGAVCSGPLPARCTAPWDLNPNTGNREDPHFMFHTFPLSCIQQAQLSTSKNPPLFSSWEFGIKQSTLHIPRPWVQHEDWSWKYFSSKQPFSGQSFEWKCFHLNEPVFYANSPNVRWQASFSGWRPCLWASLCEPARRTLPTNELI